MLDLVAIEELSRLEKAAPNAPISCDYWNTHPGIYRAFCEAREDRDEAKADAHLWFALRNAAPSLLALAKEALLAREWLKADDRYWDYENQDGSKYGFDHDDFEGLKYRRVAACEDFRAIVAAHDAQEGS